MFPGCHSTTFTHSFGSPFSPFIFLFVAILYLNIHVCSQVPFMYVRLYLRPLCTKERKDHPLGKHSVLSQRREGNENCINSGRFRSSLAATSFSTTSSSLLISCFSSFSSSFLAPLDFFFDCRNPLSRPSAIFVLIPASIIFTNWPLILHHHKP